MLLCPRKLSWIIVYIINVENETAEISKDMETLWLYLGKQGWIIVNFFFPLYFYGFLCICTSAAPQSPAHGTVPSQVATHLRTDRVCRVLGRSWI